MNIHFSIWYVCLCFVIKVYQDKKIILATQTFQKTIKLKHKSDILVWDFKMYNQNH